MWTGSTALPVATASGMRAGREVGAGEGLPTQLDQGPKLLLLPAAQAQHLEPKPACSRASPKAFMVLLPHPKKNLPAAFPRCPAVSQPARAPFGGRPRPPACCRPLSAWPHWGRPPASAVRGTRRVGSACVATLAAQGTGLGVSASRSPLPTDPSGPPPPLPPPCAHAAPPASPPPPTHTPTHTAPEPPSHCRRARRWFHDRGGGLQPLLAAGALGCLLAFLHPGESAGRCLQAEEMGRVPGTMHACKAALPRSPSLRSLPCRRRMQADLPACIFTHTPCRHALSPATTRLATSCQQPTAQTWRRLPASSHAATAALPKAAQGGQLAATLASGAAAAASLLLQPVWRGACLRWSQRPAWP